MQGSQYHPIDKQQSEINLYGSNQRFATKETEVTSPKNDNFQKQSFSRGRSKTPTSYPIHKTKGIMEKAILQRLQVYKKAHKIKKMDIERIYKLNQTQNQDQNLKEKPLINQKSQKLFDKRKKQRKLSPNVFQRFETYERQKSKDKVLKTINRILEVTPKKKITQKDLCEFATPKQIKYLKQLFKSQNEDKR